MEYTQPIGDDPGDPYIDANPGAGIEGSAVPAAAIEHPQREIVNAIAAAGLEPDSGDLTQLTAAIEAMIDAAVAPLGSPVGTVVSTIQTTPPTGWLLLNGDNIGSAASGADQASDDYEALFELFWNAMADGQAPVSGGRGASAAADWAANKVLTMPDARGRTIIGGGTGAALSPRANGETGGEEEHLLTAAESGLQSHNHSVPTVILNVGGGSNSVEVFSVGSGGSATSDDVNNAGGSSASQSHNNMQPWLALNWIVRY